MKSLKQFAGITLFGALACAGLQAQTMNLKATIPFDFTVGRTALPAGNYTIEGNGAMVTFRQEDARKPANMYVITIGGPGVGPNESPRLEFHQYGRQYFLASIKSSSAAAGRELPQSGPEKELAKRVGSLVNASVVAVRQ
ncbi:MAG TPA: hypothetical protein VGL72_26515 [Bryobacteraceae bacterium]